MNNKERILEEKLNNCYGVVYLTTNLINGKTYVGQTIKKGDDFNKYLGSGVLIKKDIKEYGVKNFKKEILWYCSTKEELNNLEIKLIEECNPDYNIAKGGSGGDTYSGRSELSKAITRKKTSLFWASRTKDEIAEIHNKRLATIENMSEEMKALYSENRKGSWTPERLSEYKTRMESQWKNMTSEEKELRIRPLREYKKNNNNMDDPRVRAKISRTLKGRTLSPEHRSHIIEGLTGRVASESQKKKTKESNIEFYMLNGTFIVLEDIELGTKEIFYSLRQAVRETSLNISFFTKRLKDSNFIARKVEYRTKKVRYATEEERSKYISDYYKEKSLRKQNSTNSVQGE